MEDADPAFQYRKRYEVTCDAEHVLDTIPDTFAFQYRKRYEVTCDWKRFLL